VQKAEEILLKKVTRYRK
jgi:hypothetical protein